MRSLRIAGLLHLAAVDAVNLPITLTVDAPALPLVAAPGEPCACGMPPRLYERPPYRGHGTAVSCPRTVVPPYFALSFARRLRYKGDKRRACPWTVPCTPPKEAEDQL